MPTLSGPPAEGQRSIGRIIPVDVTVRDEPSEPAPAAVAERGGDSARPTRTRRKQTGGFLKRAERLPDPSLLSARTLPQETSDAYQLKADLPGVKKEDVSLDVDGNVIRIGAKRSEQTQKEETSPDRRWHRSERRAFSDFQQRALRMPENTDFSKLKASYDDGTLTIDVKKVPEEVPKVKQIPIA